MFRLLGVESRQRILDILRGGPKSVSEIARLLGITQPATSQHLAALREAGFVRDERRGQQVFYSLEPAASSRYRLANRAFGWRRPGSARREQLEEYRAFLREELDRVEREIGDRGQDGKDA
jgi:DNA-binding transcriptional ArsR family regulator